MNAEFIKRFLRSSSVMEKAALEVYERLPQGFRRRVFYGPAFFRWLSLLKESEEWDKDKFESYQFEQAKNLLVHATKNVPYYRKLFSDIGFCPQKMQSLDDVTSLPYLSKETVREKSGEFVDERRPLHSLKKKFTSGSTGIPMTIYESREAEAAFHAFRANLLGRIGHTPRSREVMLWAFIETGKRKNLPFMGYGNKLVLSARYLTGEWLSKCCDMLRKFDPEYVSGYPSSLSVLSSFIKSNHLASGKKLKAVITYSETLCDWQRELIGEAFGARVFSMYSMMENAALGGECEQSTELHIYPQYGLTGLAKSVRGHEEIIATGFTNYAMPLIRYKTCDLVTGGKEFCSKCGRSHKTFRAIEGRVQDFLVGKDGEIIPRLMPWIKTFPNVRQVQFYQEEPGRASLKIVKDKAYTDADTQYIKGKLDEMLGLMRELIQIGILFVDEIQPTPSGKVNMVEQRLDMKDFL